MAAVVVALAVVDRVVDVSVIAFAFTTVTGSCEVVESIVLVVDSLGVAVGSDVVLGDDVMCTDSFVVVDFVVVIVGTVVVAESKNISKI